VSLVSIVLASVPAPEEPDKLFAVTKVIGSTLVLAAIGVVIYWLGRSRTRTARSSAEL
jgi:hypothetical protein